MVGLVAAGDLGNLAYHGPGVQQSFDALAQLQLQLEVVGVERQGRARKEAEQEYPARSLMVRRPPLVHRTAKVAAVVRMRAPTDVRQEAAELLSNGEPLVAGRRLTAVTDRQIHQLGVAITPLHPEAALRAAGARFEGRTHPVRDFFANHYVADGDLVTGQNQNAGPMVARLLMQRVLAKQRPASVTTDPRPAARVA